MNDLIHEKAATLCFQYGADLPESVYVEGDAVFLDFTGRMPAHLHVAGNLSVDRAAADMLPAGTIVGNDLYVLEFLTDVGPVNLPDGLTVNGDVHLPETSEVVFGKRTEISGDIIDGSENPLAERPLPSTGPELSRFALEMEAHVREGWVYGRMPGWLSKTQSDEGQAFVIDGHRLGLVTRGLPEESNRFDIVLLHISTGGVVPTKGVLVDRVVGFGLIGGDGAWSDIGYWLAEERPPVCRHFQPSHCFGIVPWNPSPVGVGDRQFVSSQRVPRLGGLTEPRRCLSVVGRHAFA